ncbi:MULTISPECIES: S9 family peptidase [unclassified Massilia]|uniref:S9 family peptidase n=1 Tax=unclassified Massilia TaxID=2609279 RepID=UPI00177DA01A|nr:MULTISPECIES: S9 family peptidase [unclassified Massilia]MBD8532260.1 S9 family peptidase [Massilia sp. CFBP 13647]MBD8675665.1 S9 family peptidase [Massilia sp. CFBP 13721]
MRVANVMSRAALAACLLGAALVHSVVHGSEMREYRQVAMSGGGEAVVAVEWSDPGIPGQRPHGRIVVRDAASGRITAEYDPCAACSYDFPTWSPDRKAVAFIGADRAAGSATLWVARGGEVSAAATVKGVANTARWSPDGASIALLATVDARKQTGAVEAGARLVGEIGVSEDAQRIALVPSRGGALRLVSPPDVYVYEYDWTPDGRGFVATSARGNGDNNWWVATLGHIDVNSGALRIVAAPKMQISLPHVSPDGRSVAFVGGLMSDFGSVGGDVFTVPLAGGEPVDVTPGYDGSFNGLAWKGSGLLASSLQGSEMAVVAIDPQARSTRTLWSGAVTANGSGDGRIVFSADGSSAVSVHETYEQAPRIVAGRLPTLVPITRENAGFAPQVASRSLTWTNEGLRSQGWLIGPREPRAGVKHPLVVIVHGGPASAATPRYVAPGDFGNPLVRELVERGFYVFQPNPRGSYGQGLAFTQANRRDFGGGDWRDILAGVDAVVAQAPVDGERLGLMGHSYGGFMTMWGVTHSKRFKAAVAGAGIANWISYYGQNGIDQWMVPFFGAAMYDDPAIYRAASPIESIKNATTPTLLYVGERDVETPAVQSMEFWHGLRAIGTPTTLVIYDGEGHAIRKPEHQLDQRRRTVAWFEKYLK